LARRAADRHGWRRRARLRRRQIGSHAADIPATAVQSALADEESAPASGSELVPGGHLRASHDDRDRAVELLRVAAGDGRLTLESSTSEWVLP